MSANQNSLNMPRQQQQAQQQQQQQHQQQQQQHVGNTRRWESSVSNSEHNRDLGNFGPNNEGNYNEIFLNKLRAHRSCNAIVFNLEETMEVSEANQKFIDQEEIKDVLNYIACIEDNDEDLNKKVVEITRLGRRTNGKIRPVKVRFENAYYRDMAVMNGFRIKYMDSYLRKTKICKDLIRDDREKAKRDYEKKKQDRLAAMNGNSDASRTITEQAPPTRGSNDSQGTTGGAQAVPRQEEQTNQT